MPSSSNRTSTGIARSNFSRPPVKACTVGEAIAEAEQLLQIRLVWDNAREYFRVPGVRSPEGMPVGISVFRHGQSVYRGRDMGFPLQEMDTFGFGGLCD